MKWSQALNRFTGGKRGQSLCGRIAAKYGHDCLFCRIIERVLRDPDHCWNERMKEFKRGA